VICNKEADRNFLEFSPRYIYIHMWFTIIDWFFY